MENAYGMEMLANGDQLPPQGASRPQPIHIARYPPSYGHQQFQQQQQQQYQQQQQQYTGYQQQQQQYYYQQQQQQQYLQQVHMSSLPEYNALRGSSPVSNDKADLPAQCGHSPGGGWSSETDSSGFSSPPSDAGGRGGGDEWDLLSDMLIEDALASAPVPPPPSSSSTVQQGLYKQPPQYMPMVPSHQYIQQQQQQVPMSSSSLLPVAPSVGNFSSVSRSHSSVAPHPIAKTIQTPPATAAASAPSTPPLEMVSSSSVFTGSQSIQPVNISPAPRVRASTKKNTAAVATTAAAAAPVKVEPVSTEEQKKLRRRTQIATSVQRHREKKKTLVSSLKQDLASLTSHLVFLRSQRKILHANDRLVEWEETAITQRRKRKQSEEVNERMKKALFQQTSFLMGMRSMVMGDLPAPRELQFHDWIHSYTVLSARDLAGRRREYASYFSESKMDLAAKIVVRETEGAMARLDRSHPYYASVLLLHDGTHVFANELDVPVKRELQQECYDVGNGQVMKKYTSIFLFEDNVSFDTFHQVAWECTKQVGVFWPGAGYQSQVQDVVEVGNGSRVYFTDLSASMGLLDDVQDDENQHVTVESRMLCREQKSENESIILWDYVDRDDLYPLPLGEEALRKQTITRKSCGAVVVRKEPSGLVSIRSTSIKIFDTTLPVSRANNASQSQADTDTIASMNRRLGLQATEAERGQQKCIRYVYDAILATFSAAGALNQ